MYGVNLFCTTLLADITRTVIPAPLLDHYTNNSYTPRITAATNQAKSKRDTYFNKGRFTQVGQDDCGC